MPNSIVTFVRNRQAAGINPRPVVNRNPAPVMNMGTELLNPPPTLTLKLMELQAELNKHFPNQPNVVVAFNGHGGCLIGMDKQGMKEFIQTVQPARTALPTYPRPLPQTPFATRYLG
jgi:hypothetical protein